LGRTFPYGFSFGPSGSADQDELAPSSGQPINLSFTSGEIRIQDNPLFFIRIFVKTKFSASKGILHFKNNCTLNIVSLVHLREYSIFRIIAP
jgi:hypothetical protein